MDIDHDGFIDTFDISTVIGNLQNDTFYKNNGETLAITSGLSKMSDWSTSDASWFPKEKMTV